MPGGDGHHIIPAADFSGIHDRSVIAQDGAGRSLRLLDLRRSEDVDHLARRRRGGSR